MMSRYFENELKILKKDILEMWTLVESQIRRAGEAFINNDKDIAKSVLRMERKVDAFELKIDSECENYLALNTPVAVDLRFILSVLKINTALERLGDFAKSIAYVVIDQEQDNMNSDLLSDLKIETMIDVATKMITTTKKSFELSDSKLACSIFAEDDILDELDRKAEAIVIAAIEKDMKLIHDGIVCMNIIKKMERVGDHCTNIAEEIIFYVEAKVLKHIKLQEETEVTK